MTEKLFPILCPTRDFQGPPAWTMIALCNAVRELGKEPVYLQQSSAGYAYIRTLLFHQARQVLKVDSIRGLMIDDDILLTSASAFASAVRFADSEGLSFAAPYVLRDWSVMLNASGDPARDQWIIERPTTARRSSIATGRGQCLLASEVEKIPAWSKIPLAGLGFYYGELPLAYEFRETSSGVLGEDHCFIRDNQIDLRLANFWVRHIRTMIL